jgi:hypothetical protein
MFRMPRPERVFESGGLRIQVRGEHYSFERKEGDSFMALDSGILPLPPIPPVGQAGSLENFVNLYIIDHGLELKNLLEGKERK